MHLLGNGNLKNKGSVGQDIKVTHTHSLIVNMRNANHLHTVLRKEIIRVTLTHIFRCNYN